MLLHDSLDNMWRSMEVPCNSTAKALATLAEISMKWHKTRISSSMGPWGASVKLARRMRSILKIRLCRRISNKYVGKRWFLDREESTCQGPREPRRIFLSIFVSSCGRATLPLLADAQHAERALSFGLLTSDFKIVQLKVDGRKFAKSCTEVANFP